MRIGKKKESILGLIVTVVLCLGFLWWWFRPAAQLWTDQSAVQLVERAAGEATPGRGVERQVLDLDLLEIAIAQVGERRKAEATAVVGHIVDPVIRTLAARRMALTYMSGESQDYGEALDFASLACDAEQQSALRSEILGMLAGAGFPDAAVPEAKTPLQKAQLANRILSGDDKVRMFETMARGLQAEAEAALPSVPPAEEIVVKREIIRGKILLTRQAPPAEAIAAIKTLPVEQRGELWIDLIDICQGRNDRAEMVPLVYQQIDDPAIRRRVEIVSLVFGVKVRPAADILADCQADVDTASTPERKVAALLTLSKVQYDGGSDELREMAAATMKTALETAQTITDPAARCRALLDLAERFSAVVEIDAAGNALQLAVSTARDVASPAERIPLLVRAEDVTYQQSDVPGAIKLMEEAEALIAQTPGSPDAATVESLGSALMRRGHWTRAFTLVEKLQPETARRPVLQAVVTTAAENLVSEDLANPPPRGEPFDTIRREAIADQVKAANLAEAQPAGYVRARAWLAMAKAVFTPPVSLTSYMTGGAQPGSASPDDDLPPEAVPPPDSEVPPVPENE
jgi:hypothetical protein